MRGTLRPYLHPDQMRMSNRALQQLGAKLQTSGYCMEAYGCWLRSTRSPSTVWHDNNIMHPSVWEDFIAYAAEENKLAENTIALELDELFTCLKLHAEDLTHAFTIARMHSVSPLLIYTTARSLGVEAIAATYKQAAIRQIHETPWFVTALTPKLKEHLPK